MDRGRTYYIFFDSWGRTQEAEISNFGFAIRSKVHVS